jgi:hypothetical protein
MRKAFRVIPWIILIVPFIVPAFYYDVINDQILVMRSFIGNQAIVAPKSLFTVFRVPLIEIVCGAAVEIMKSRYSRSEANADSFSMWDILLYTVAFKSLFQVFEFISSTVYYSPDYADVFFYATLFTVIGGICLAIIKGRNILLNFKRGEWKFSLREKVTFGILLAAYFVLAIAPMFIFKTV